MPPARAGLAALLALAACPACVPVRPEAAAPADAASAVATAADVTTAEELHALVLDIVARLDALETRYGSRSDGEVTSVFRAEMGAAGAEYVEERRGRGDLGLALVRYFYSGGRVILYQEEGEHLLPGPGGVSRRETFARSIFFSPAGRVVSATGQVDGRATDPDDAAIAEARSRATAMFALAPGGRLVHEARPAGTPPPPDLMHPRESMPTQEAPP